MLQFTDDTLQWASQIQIRIFGEHISAAIRRVCYETFLDYQG
jgi:hypothetical protein